MHLAITIHFHNYVTSQLHCCAVTKNQRSPDSLIEWSSANNQANISATQHSFSRSILAAVVNNDDVVNKLRHCLRNRADVLCLVMCRHNRRYAVSFVHTSIALCGNWRWQLEGYSRSCLCFYPALKVRN